METVAVLSGGGAKGYWQWRTLMLLHEAGIKPSLLCGTSTGTLTGFLYSKGLFKEAEELYQYCYENDARNVFSSKLAKVKKGKIDVNWLKVILKLPSINKTTSLLGNQPLYDSLMALHKKFPKFNVPLLFNVVDMKSGKPLACSTQDFDNDEDLINALVASTAIPVVTSMRSAGSFKFLGDGGLREGTPLSQAFKNMDPAKPYQIIVLSCNDPFMDTEEDKTLSTLSGIAGRTIEVMLNENLLADLDQTVDRNNLALNIWPIIDALRSSGNTAQADELAKRFPFRYVPIKMAIYKGKSGVFSFTKEAFEEQKKSALESFEGLMA